MYPSYDMNNRKIDNRKTMADMRRTAVERYNAKPETVTKWRNNGVVYFNRLGAKCWLLHATEIVNVMHGPGIRTLRFDTGGHDSVTTRRAMNEAIREAGNYGMFGVYRKRGKTWCGHVKFDRVCTVIVTDDVLSFHPDVGDSLEVARL